MVDTWEERVLSSDAARISPEAAEALIEQGKREVSKPTLPPLWEVDDGS